MSKEGDRNSGIAQFTKSEQSAHSNNGVVNVLLQTSREPH